MERSTRLPADVSAPATARRLVCSAVAFAGYPRLAEVAALLTSELVTNAVRHGTPPILLRVDCGHDSVTVVVSDCGGGIPLAPSPSLERPGGRGLELVHQLAQQWGVTPLDGSGKEVWFLLTGGTLPD